MTHTYAILEVSQTAFNQISQKLAQAGYADQIHVSDAPGLAPNGTVLIDMNGIALQAAAPANRTSARYMVIFDQTCIINPSGNSMGRWAVIDSQPQQLVETLLADLVGNNAPICEVIDITDPINPATVLLCAADKKLLGSLIR